MHASLNDLSHYSVETADGAAGRVEDLYLGTEDRTLRYALVDVGGWFADRTAVIAASKFGAPDSGGRRWPVSLTREEIESAPSPGVELPDRRASFALDLGAMPSIVVGPAGGVYSPVLLEAQIAEIAGVTGSAGEDGADTAFFALSAIRGREVEGTDGALGTLSDLLVEEDGFRLSFLVIDTGGLLPQRQIVVPADRIAALDAEGPIRLDATKDEVEKSPALQEVDLADRNWFDSLLAYYGLGR